LDRSSRRSTRARVRRGRRKTAGFLIESGSGCSQLHDAIDRTELDTFRRVVIIDAFDAGVSVDYVSVLADAHRFGRAFGPAGVTIDAVFGNCIGHRISWINEQMNLRVRKTSNRYASGYGVIRITKMTGTVAERSEVFVLDVRKPACLSRG